MDQQLIHLFIINHQHDIAKLYHAHRDAFIHFGKKYNLQQEDLTDIYQDAFVAIRQHAINGKLDEVKSSFKTYLFGIGKFMIYDRLKEKQKTASYDANLHVVHDEIEVVHIEDDSSELSKEQQLLRVFFVKLGKKCRELLTLFYSNGLSIDEIVETSGYNSNAVVRSQKSRCVKQLKEMINTKRYE